MLAQIARENNAMMVEMAAAYRGPKGVYELCDHLIGLFKQELRQKRFQSFDCDPLPPDEEPVIIESVKLKMMPWYF